MSKYMLLLLRFFTFFFENPKNVTFYVFFALLHTFSRTMCVGKENTYMYVFSLAWVVNIQRRMKSEDATIQSESGVAAVPDWRITPTRNQKQKINE